MLSRVIDNMEFSDFEDRVPYQYSHYLRLNGKDEDLAYRYQADLFTIIRYRASSTQSLRSIIHNSQPQ